MLRKPAISRYDEGDDDMRKSIALLSFVICLFAADAADAGWSGPAELISGRWGSGKGQFGIRTEGGFEVLPAIGAITNDENVVIRDAVNRKQLIFNGKGALSSEVKWDAARGQGENAIAAIPHKDREAETALAQRMAVNVYQVTVVFPDRNVVVTSDTEFKRAMRDRHGNVYGFTPELVLGFDKNGKQTGTLNLPASHEELVTIPGQPARGMYVIYGEPVVGPSGSIYLTKKTDTGFAVLKWTWK